MSMHQIKLFKSIETNITDLESQINDWLAKSGAHVIQIFGNIAPQTGLVDQTSAGYITKSPHGPSDVLVAILYEKR